MRISLCLFSSLLFLCGGCSYFMPNPWCPPPPSAKCPTTETFSCTNPTVAPVIPDACACLSLAELVDIGLQNSPATRSAWYLAKQASADVGTARGAFLPSWDLQLFWLKESFPQTAINDFFTFREEIQGFTVSTTYLLFDFGGRNANLKSALAALSSLCWRYNWQVQTVMNRVIQSYYNYIFYQGIVQTDRATVEDNRTTVEAATARRSAGVTSRADELQAKTVLVQSQITLEQDLGNFAVAQARLVQALGLPPDTPLCISELPGKIAGEAICEDMSVLLQATKERRGDLKAQRANILQRRFQVQIAQSTLLPNANTQITAGKEAIDGSRYLDTYTVQLNLNVPLFHGFADTNAYRKAQAAVLEAQATLDLQELDAFLQTLTDYFQLVAAQKVLTYSDSYIAIATENREVAFANYIAGRTTILDLMLANNSLDIARKQLVQAKANFLTNLANLAYDTGSITVEDLYCLGPHKYPPWTEHAEEN